MAATLAIDPATKCGFAVAVEPGIPVDSGTWHLDRGPHRTRWLSLWARLDEIHERHPVGRIAHELVEQHPTPGIPGKTNVYAAHCYGALVAVLEMGAETHKVSVLPIPVGTIKKHATGKGNARKEAMVAAAKLRWPEIRICDDNHADALWILDTYTSSSPGPREEE